MEPWIALPSGKKYNFIEPSSDMIDIQDIATKLSKIPRFMGTLVGDWSVLQHSLLVYYLSHRENDHPKTQFTALHHDAPEAYMGDLPKPMVNNLGASTHHKHGYRELYTMCAVVVKAKLGVYHDLVKLPEELQLLDSIAAQMEWYLFGPHTPEMLGMTDEKFDAWNKDYVLGDWINTLRTTDRNGVIDLYLAYDNKLKRRQHL